MKKSLLLPLALLVSVCSFGQGSLKNKKGYIGISFGPTIFTGSTHQASFIVPISDDASSSQPGEVLSMKAGDIGLTINLIDAGYVIWRHWGVSFKWQGGAHIYKSRYEEFRVGFGAIMIGPMYSINLNEKMSLDFKARAGRMYLGNEYEFSMTGTVVQSNSDYLNIGLEAASSLRYHFAPKWSWVSNLEFQSHLIDSSLAEVSRVNLTTGIGFRF